MFLFLALLELNGTQFKLVYDSIMWAIKHTMRSISELGLEILQTMIQKFQTCDQQAAQTFYKAYYLETMQHIFAVVTECSHTSGQIDFKINNTVCFKIFFISMLNRFNSTFTNSG